MAPMEVLVLVAGGLAAFLAAGLLVTDRQLRRVERDLAVTEAARRTPAE